MHWPRVASPKAATAARPQAASRPARPQHPSRCKAPSRPVRTPSSAAFRAARARSHTSHGPRARSSTRRPRRPAGKVPRSQPAPGRVIPARKSLGTNPNRWDRTAGRHHSLLDRYKIQPRSVVRSRHRQGLKAPNIRYEYPGRRSERGLAYQSVPSTKKRRCARRLCAILVTLVMGWKAARRIRSIV